MVIDVGAISVNNPIQLGSDKLNADAYEDKPYTLTAEELLHRITDIDVGDSISISGVVSADHGSIINNNDETYTFNPENNYNGDVTFSFRVTDGNGGFVDATQTLVIQNVNDDPVQTADF